MAHNIGDPVTWKGLDLIVIELKDNGDVEALSPTMRVTAPAKDFINKLKAATPSRKSKQPKEE